MIPSSTDRPNIVLFLFDSFGADDYTRRSDKLPCLKAIQSRSVSFSRAYCGSPEGTPARASLFTGLDMAAHGVWTDGVALPDHEKTIGERFTQSGYQSWLFGRRQLAGVANWTTEHIRAGEYNHVEWAHGPLHRSRQNAYLNWLKVTSGSVYDEIFPIQPNPDDTDIPDKQRKAMADLPDELSFNCWIGSSVNERIKNRDRNMPFFAVAGFVVGETMGAQPNTNSVVDKVNHQALLQADMAVGSVRQTIQSERLGENTIAIVASCRGSGDGLGIDETLHEQAIRTPLFICAPDQASKQVDTPVSTMDISSTLYQLAKLKEPTRTHGKSLLTQKPRRWSLSRLRHPMYQHQTALSNDRFKLIVVHGRIDIGQPSSYQLYDLQKDPGQKQDLANLASHQDQLESMIDQLIDTRVALEDRTEPRVAKF